MKIIYLSLIIFCTSTIAQVDTPKQLTSFNFDSRNPEFIQYPYNIPWFIEEPELFFEAVYSDSFSTICFLKYNEAIDSFYQFTELTPVIDSNTVHTKPVGRHIENYPDIPFKILLWETNENGSWDIAFSIDSGNGWTPYDFMFSSDEDELDPSFIVDLFNYNYQTNFQFLYFKGNSVYFFSKDDSVQNIVLFEGNDSIKYSDPAGAYSGYDGNLYAVAVEEKNGEQPRLVYRMKNSFNNVWSEIRGVFERAPSAKPKFTDTGWGETYLAFEVFAERMKKILLIHPEDFGTAGNAIGLVEEPEIETSEFSSFAFGIITEEPGDDFYTYFPFSFKFTRNDSAYIRVGIDDFFYNPYFDFHTKVKDSKPDLGPLSLIWEGVVSYTVWEDSSDGRINLFGIKRIDPLGDVKDESTSNKDFNLLQNYPNPFNPITTIQYTLSKRQSIAMKVFDVLGREAATLINEEKQPGVYEVEFDASELSSGIYFYQLKAGSAIQTKKMILIK